MSRSILSGADGVVSKISRVSGSLSLHGQKPRPILSRVSQCPGKRKLRDVVREQAIDVVQARACDVLLTLDNREIIRDTLIQLLAREDQRLVIHLHILLSNLDLACSGLQIQKRISHITFDL